MLPGCRGPGDKGYNPSIDGTTTGLVHPFTGQKFANEMAVFSWNVLMGLVGFSLPSREFGDTTGPRGAPNQDDFDVERPVPQGRLLLPPSPSGARTSRRSSASPDSSATPSTRAATARFGRRDFVYHSGGDGVLRVDKSNIFGFSMDFAEDVTKSNWGVEFTWVKDLHVGDNNSADGLTDGIDLHRLTISVDRPTFVNFMNANRTFFINTQWFVQYVDGFQKGFTGPLYHWDIFGVLAISTGYFQDRLLPSLTMVYFVRNNSFAVLPQVTYRFTENFQASVGRRRLRGPRAGGDDAAQRARARRRALRPQRLQVLRRAGARPGARTRRDLPPHPVHVLSHRGRRWGADAAACGSGCVGLRGARGGGAARGDGAAGGGGLCLRRARRGARLLRDADPLAGARLPASRTTGTSRQWWNILSLEIEANVAPDGWGPFDVISVFGRIEVRYDCVWTGGCSMFDSANAYAFSRFGKLPKRLNDGRRTGYQGTNYIGDTRHYTDIPFDLVASAPDDRRLRPDGSRQPMEFWQTPIGTGFFSALSYGLDGLPQTADDLGFFYFEDLTTRPLPALGRPRPPRLGERPQLRRDPDARPGLRLREHRGEPRTSRTRSGATTSIR